MDNEYSLLAKAHEALKIYSSGTAEEIPKDLEYVAGMIAMLKVFGYEAWNEGGKWSVKAIETGKLLIDKDQFLI